MKSRAIDKIPEISNGVCDKVRRLRSVIRCNNGMCWENIFSEFYKEQGDSKYVEFLEKNTADKRNGVILYIAFRYQDKTFTDNLKIEDINLDGLDKKIDETEIRLKRNNPNIMTLIEVMTVMNRGEKYELIKKDIILSYLIIEKNFKQQYKN
jgi:hypothetical protein